MLSSPMASIALHRLSAAPHLISFTKPATPKPGNPFYLSTKLPLSSFCQPLKSEHKFFHPEKSNVFTCMSSYNPTPAVDRLISAVAYTLPLFNSLHYSRFLFAQYPNLGLLFDPIFPLLNLYRSMPYASFVAFFALYLGVVRNSIFSYYVRFNAMQAVTLDVLLVIPLLLQRILGTGRGGFGFKVMVWGHNLVFAFTALCFVYSTLSCVLGRTPYLPFVADAASRQV